MRGDQPVVSAASLIVSASIRAQTLTQVCQGSAGRSPSAWSRARPPRLHPLLELGDLPAPLGRLRVAPGLVEQATALRRGGELGDAIQDWHGLVLPGRALERAFLEPEVLDGLDPDDVHLRLLELARVVPVHRLPAGELVEHPDAGLAGAVAGLAVAAEGQVRLGAGRGVVDRDHAGGDALAEAERVRARGR